MLVNNKGNILGSTSNPKTIRNITVQIISLLQDYKRGDIIYAASIVWLLLCERFDVSPNDMLAKAERIKADLYVEGKMDHQLLAMKEYFKNEL